MTSTGVSITRHQKQLASRSSGLRAAVSGVRQSRRGLVAANASKVFVVNTPGGGHAVLGFHLAKQLTADGHDVTIMVPGEETSDKMKKEPFSRFDELRSVGVTTVWGSPSDCASAAGSGTYDVVVDNNGKDLDTCQPVIDWAVGQGAKQFLYVSSAGIYQPSDTPPHVEGDAVKESASHVSVENYLKAASVEESIFRPQYITGDANNKVGRPNTTTTASLLQLKQEETQKRALCPVRDLILRFHFIFFWKPQNANN